jgi:hypothetical protein
MICELDVNIKFPSNIKIHHGFSTPGQSEVNKPDLSYETNGLNEFMAQFLPSEIDS